MQEALAHIDTSAFGRQMERGAALIVKHVHAGVAAQEGVHGLSMAPTGGGQKGRPAQGVLGRGGDIRIRFTVYKNIRG